MNIIQYDDAAAFAEQHGEDWRRIAAESHAATIFQTWEWTAAWWEHNSRGKRFWGMAFLQDAAVVGCAALFLPAGPAPLRTLRLAGTGGSDFLDILAAPGQEASVSAAFFAHLRATTARWDWSDLQQVRPSAVLVATDPLPQDSGLRAETWVGETCPYLPLAPTWEAFRKTLGKKLRQNIGYYERALEKQFASVEYRLATAETLKEDMEAFFQLHQQRWRQRWMPGAFAAESARAFHADAARRLLEAGYLRLHTLRVDGRPVAALYCFHKDNRCYYYLGGFAPDLARLSVGTVLTARAIRHAIEVDGATEFDFLRGDEGYKYKWGAQDRFNQRLSVTHPGLRPALLAAAGRTSLRVEKILKGYMHKLHGGAAEHGKTDTRGHKGQQSDG